MVNISCQLANSNLDLEAKAEELQKSLDSATAQINELQNEKVGLIHVYAKLI
ncbi:hypothetical protein DSO57_1006012 [Entomophthora muscae]|uniref:Uncharacterized protein n=1 Tax=Entomophthora muscae TaxID=34485 RepID=A0ACC2SKG4_9FUNG|nr:hypothetical protein DSO57_1006012 [Entomophthora muscae]